MSGAAILVFVAIASATLIVLTVMVISLFRQLVRVVGALAEMNEALRPLLEEIQSESGRAQSRLSRIAETRTKLRANQRAR